MKAKNRLLTVVDPQVSRYDISSANMYGDVTTIGGLLEISSPFATDDMVKAIDTFVERIAFDPEEDGFIMTGNTIVMSIAFGYLLARFGSVKTLLYDATKHSYSVRRVSLPKDLIESEEL